jgi:hypothetical protein
LAYGGSGDVMQLITVRFIDMQNKLIQQNTFTLAELTRHDMALRLYCKTKDLYQVTFSYTGGISEEKAETVEGFSVRTNSQKGIDDVEGLFPTS